MTVTSKVLELKPIHHLCFWIVGTSIAIDLHDANGGVIRPGRFDEPILINVPASSEAERKLRGYSICVAIAQSHGLEDTAVSYDQDSTEFFAK